MKLKFVIPNLKEGKRYKGVISRYTVDKEKTVLRVYVIIDKEPSLEFMKRMDIDLNINSNFALFCSNMKIFTEENEVDLDRLLDIRVIVQLQKGRDDMLYIDRCRLDQHYYQQEEGENE